MSVDPRVFYALQDVAGRRTQLGAQALKELTDSGYFIGDVTAVHRLALPVQHQ